MRASELRRAFTDFMVQRGHTAVESSGVIPHHPTAPLFTNAGMNQFVPYFLGEEPPPYARATSIQKCMRISGKHSDIDELGKTRRHLTFFEMLGNFSFGDYFKEEAIPMAWELCTEVVGFDGDRLWVTVHHTDDDAEAIWHEVVGLPMDRIQRLGDVENFWEMGDTGPCGPNSEIHFDCGPEWGEPGGPAHGGGDRYVEFWNLVFMQYERHRDTSLTELPAKNVDTGAGMERWLMLLDGVDTVFDADPLRLIVAEAEAATGQRYGSDVRVTTSLRVLADHARTMTFLAAGGVAPSNEERGYVMRSVVRRAVRHAYMLGVETEITPRLIGSVVDHMGDAYPELTRERDDIIAMIEHEEGTFLRTVRNGLTLLETELAKQPETLSGEVVFKLHDTFGFPKELTAEIAEEQHVEVDLEGFEAEMERQRSRSKAGRAAGATAGDIGSYREVLERYGPTDFVGYESCEAQGRLIAALPVAEGGEGADGTNGSGQFEVFLDRTPFYAEGGGQIGDTGLIRTPSGLLRVLDTTPAVGGLTRHLVEVVEGEVERGADATAEVDRDRREHTRRNHTGTHLLHAALRAVLGGHVHQQGSHVGPERLRFDLNHHAPITPEQLQEVEDMANADVLQNVAVRAFETTMDEAKKMGALAFFGDKYGDVVRVVEAGPHSIELCGGTHVHALGSVGPIKIVGEGSIGSNMRRVEALTGTGALTLVRDDEQTLTQAATLLRTTPDDIVAAVERLLARQKDVEDELKGLQRELARGEATRLAAGADGGIVVERRDGLGTDQLRDLAVAVRNEPGVTTVVLAGTPDGARVAIVGAVDRDTDVSIGELVGAAARLCGGGGGGKGEIAVAGGRDVSKIDEALAGTRTRLGIG